MCGGQCRGTKHDDKNLTDWTPASTFHRNLLSIGKSPGRPPTRRSCRQRLRPFFLVVATYAITQVFRVARPFVPGVIPHNVKVARNKFVATSEKCACVPFFCPNSTRVIAKAGQAPPIKPFTLSPLAERTLDRRLVHLPPLQCSPC